LTKNSTSAPSSASSSQKASSNLVIGPKSKTTLVAVAATEVPPPITKSQLIIDSGCSHGTLQSWQDGMTNREQIDWLIHFGNGSVSKIPERGCIGNLTGISICPDIAVQVVSVSQLSAQLDCPVIFTGENAYILKPGSTVQFKETSIMLTAD
jgi:hypothetical protein